jgi:membrane protease YdiL (CAAX protease family)
MQQYHNHTRQFVIRAVLFEGGLGVVALIWAYWRKIPWQQALTPTIRSCWLGVAAGVVLLLINYAIIEYGSRYIPALQTIKSLMEHQVAPLFKTLHPASVIVIAVVSGGAEELFFRGVLQAQIGLIGASLLFGLAHVWKKTAIPYGIYAAVIGGYFRGLYLLTHNLWVPMIAHMVNNGVAILYCQHIPGPMQDQKSFSEKVEL